MEVRASAFSAKRGAAAPLENTQYSRAGLVAGNVLLFGPILLVLAPGLLGLAACVAALAALLPRLATASGLGRPWVRTLALHVWLIAALVFWGCARMIWGSALQVGQALPVLNVLAILVLGLSIGGDVRRGVDRALVARAAITGISIAAAVLLLDAATGWQLMLQVSGQPEIVSEDPTLQPRQSLSGLLAISALLPLIFAAAGLSLRIGLWGWIAAGFMALAMLGLVVVTGHWLGIAAWAIGAVLLGIGYFRAESAFSSTALVGACFIALSPWLLAPLAGWIAQGFGRNFSPETAFDWVARVKTWGYAADLAWQRPLEGWGPGAAAHFPETHQLGGYILPYIAGHPHSAALQLWLEMGAIGAALACAALAAMGRRSGAALAQDRFAAAGATGALAAALVLICLDADLWNPSLWTALSLSAVMTRLFRDGA